MKVKELKNYGKSYAEILTEAEMAKRTRKTMTEALRRELGIIDLIKFWWRLRKEIKRLRAQDWSTLRERGLANKKFLDFAIQLLAATKVLVDLKGIEKASEMYRTSLGEKTHEIMSSIYPSAEEFRKCGDPFDCYREYMKAAMTANVRDGVYDVKTLEDTKNVWAFTADYCVWYEVAKELGDPYLCYLATCSADELFYTKIAAQAGFQFKRRGVRPTGEAVCDYRYERLAGRSKKEMNDL